MIQEFADAHRLRTKRDDCGETIIPGTNGQVYGYGGGELGALFMPTKSDRPRLWASLCRQGIAAGMTLRQRGDAEGAFSFDPGNPNHAKLALRLAGLKPKRQLTATRREIVARTIAQNGKLPRQEGVSAT